ncbi:MAG: cytochrome c3 family protein [Desulfovibrionaceae bacterium]|nr:cytochrome c3 family protein [Desulfovibrionaceae bacterium]
MKTIFSCFLGALLVLGLAAVASPAADRPEAPADGLKLSLLKKEVVFNHSTHDKDMACVDCHHPVEDKEEDYRPCSTSGCHDNLDPKDKSVNSLYQAFHKAKGTKFKTCVSCHIEKAGSDKDLKKELAGCKNSKCHPD